jgi:hypothetical protein
MLRAMVVSAMMAALALTLPIAFHAVGLGSHFLPMLLPLLLNGFLVSPGWAVLTALVTPFLSAFATGMPPLYPPMVAVVACEGVTLAGVSSILYARGKRSLWPALIAAVVAARLAAFASAWALASWFDLPPAFASVAIFVKGLPGVALQLAVVPIVVRQLTRRPGILFSHE